MVIPPLAPWILGAALLAGGAVASVVASRRRREALETYCLMRGYRFERARPEAELALADSFPLFRHGHNRRWGATIAGQVAGCPFTLFEYSYVTGGGKSSNRHRVTAVLFEVAEAQLPRFTLAPEGILGRLAQRFGVQDFDFEGDPEFSRAYQLQGDDEAAVRRLFTAARRAYLTAPAPDGGKPARHHLAGVGQRLLWWRAGSLPKPDDLDQLLADGDRLRRAFVDS